MTRSITLFFALLGLLFLGACAKPKIQDISERFLRAFYVNKDFSSAKLLSTKSTHKQIDAKAFYASLNPFGDEETSTIKVISVKYKKTFAECYYEVDGVRRVLFLTKLGGQWLVDMNDHTPIDPGTSFTGKAGTGFASATSEPVRLKDLQNN